MTTKPKYDLKAGDTYRGVFLVERLPLAWYDNGRRQRECDAFWLVEFKKCGHRQEFSSHSIKERIREKKVELDGLCKSCVRIMKNKDKKPTMKHVGQKQVEWAMRHMRPNLARFFEEDR